MDEVGNILIKRFSKCSVFVKGWEQDAASGSSGAVSGGGVLPVAPGNGSSGGSGDSTSDYSSMTALSDEIIKCEGVLEPEKAVKLFDMKKFTSNMSRELRSAYPDRRKLEAQCITVIAFVKDSYDLLEIPCWIMVVNIVAMDMLKSKLPPRKQLILIGSP